MHVKILGPGCKNCQTLETRTREALEHLGLQPEVENVTDYAAIAGYGVMTTPGLVADDKLLVSGRVPTTEEISRLLSESL